MGGNRLRKAPPTVFALSHDLPRYRWTALVQLGCCEPVMRLKWVLGYLSGVVVVWPSAPAVEAVVDVTMDCTLRRVCDMPGSWRVSKAKTASLAASFLFA